MPAGAALPDPVSVPFEPAAARALERARKARGEWVPIPLAEPTDGQRRRILARWGIDVRGPDTATGRAARTRWARAYVRAINRVNKRQGGGPIIVQVGQRVNLGGRPARAVRIATRKGGRAAYDAARAKPATQRIYDGGKPGARWADPSLRDW